MEVSKDQVSSLLDQGIYKSAELLGSFLLSTSNTTCNTSPIAKAERLVLLGDALFGEKAYRRALNAYKQALHYCKFNLKQNPSNSRTLSSVNRSPSPNSLSMSTINESELKFKITLCHSALSENRLALSEMESIPAKARTLRMNLTIGRLYRIARQNRLAVASYKECLRNCAFALEAIVALADLGVQAKDILSSLPQTSGRCGRSSEPADMGLWLPQYVEALCCVASNDYKGGVENLSELLLRFPNNVHLMLEIAKVEALMGKVDAAIASFDKARSLDPYVITYMDEYAMLLKAKADQPKLNKLVYDLLHIDPARPEVYVALSVLWERRDEKVRALSYAEKSLRIDDRHIPALLMKGNLAVALNKIPEAVVAFRGANELRPDLRSYEGLVNALLECVKTKDALCAARSAMKAMPESGKALTLVGDVYASHISTKEKARKFYESALRLEPDCRRAVIPLSDLLIIEGDFPDAIALLEKNLKDWADDSLHTKLADIFATTNRPTEAVTHYQEALRINHRNEFARKGLERMERQLKGLDPDGSDEEEDNDVEDAEGEIGQGE